MDRKLLWVLALVFIVMMGMRYNVSILAWVMFVPVLLLARDMRGAKGWIALFMLLQVGYFLQIAKIVTDPMPLMMALLFSAPMALGSFVLLWVYEKVRRSIDEVMGIFFFASLMSFSEWVTFATSELGSWGAMTYTQLDDMAFLQLTSLFGITFGSFFIYLSSAFIASFIHYHDRTRLLKPALIMILLYVGFYSYGVYRLENADNGKNIRVAAIASDMQITPQGIPDKTYLQAGTDTLIQKTQQAVDYGAKLVAWNEGATIIFKEEEDTFVKIVQDISVKSGVDLVIAYIMPIDGIKKFENKYLYIQRGKVLDSYFKYHPVPGEGSVKGDKIAKVHTLGESRVSGAICYDFDFPVLGRALSQKGMDIAVVPSSDWKGIDDVHGKMASVRAIEGGYALLRPVRGATSYAFDAYGKVRASMDYFEENDRIMIASIPTKRVETLYRHVGDSFVFLLGLFMLFVGYRFMKGSKA